MKNLYIITFAVSLIIKAAILAARWSGRAMRRSLEKLATMDINVKEKQLLFLREKVHQLQTQVSILQKRIKKKGKRPQYTIHERLFIIWYMETFQIPKRRITEYFGLARSTLYRWIHKIEDQAKSPTSPANKTPLEIASLIWDITKANVDWGRVRIANQLALLNIFIAASTVRNILNRPKSRRKPAQLSDPVKTKENDKPRFIPAWYSNHVWSIDTTTVYSWGLWPIHVFVAIDYYSRKMMAVTPLEGSNSGWAIDALERAFENYGPLKHIIMDQHPNFTAKAFIELLENWDVKPRFGAVGKKGSITVTERMNKTLKYEWLKRVPVIRGFDHLTVLCQDFTVWYNEWRPHMALDGARPNDVFNGIDIQRPARDAKTVPQNIELRVFRETLVTGYRIKEEA